MEGRVWLLPGQGRQPVGRWALLRMSRGLETFTVSEKH